MNEYMKIIIDEITECWNRTSIDQKKVDDFVEMIIESENIFLDGRGRSKLKLGAFAMRLVQLGMNAHEISEVTTPAIEEKDLLIICSGSGNSQNQYDHAKTAKNTGARVITVTTSFNSPLKAYSDIYLVIDANSKEEDKYISKQPLATLFEQSVELFFDSIVLMLMEKLTINEEEMFRRHNNLE